MEERKRLLTENAKKWYSLSLNFLPLMNYIAAGEKMTRNSRSESDQG
jgi:hypothetical protein